MRSLPKLLLTALLLLAGCSDDRHELSQCREKLASTQRNVELLNGQVYDSFAAYREDLMGKIRANNRCNWAFAQCMKRPDLRVAFQGAPDRALMILPTFPGAAEIEPNFGDGVDDRATGEILDTMEWMRRNEER